MGNAALERKHPTIPFMIRHEYVITSVSINVITQLVIQSNRITTHFSAIYFVFHCAKSSLKSMMEVGNNDNTSEMAQVLAFHVCKKMNSYKVQNSYPI